MPTEILNYVIIRKIAEGGMGQVFLAKNKSIHQFVAIKMLHPKFGENPVLRDRFRKEAIMLSSLDHPNIVKFLNYVENEQGIFLIMEYVDGLTLEDYIRKKTGLLVEERAFPMMDQILDAFAYAHGRGIVHRDIKPSNIFISNNGNIKILDFGIAKIMSDAGAKDASNITAGSLEYMSPEQARGHQLDVRTDIYSLGVVFHQMLTGRAPYDTEKMSLPEIRKQIVENPLQPMKEIYPYVSDEVQHLVSRATRKDPSERYQNAREMQTALAHVKRASAAGNNRGGSYGGGGNSGGNAGRMANSGNGGKKKGNAKGWIISSVAALLVLAAGGICFWIFMSRDKDSSYVDYSESWGVPQGVNLTKDGQKPPLSYKFHYADGKLRKVILVDETGEPAAEEDSVYSRYRPAYIEFEYKDNGELESREVYSPEGKFLYKATYDDGMKRSHVRKKLSDDSSVTSHYEMKFADNGQLEALHYIDSLGNKLALKGVYGESYKYDKFGRLERVTYLDSVYNPSVDVEGIAHVNFDFSNGSHTAKHTYYDAAGNPTEPKPVVSASAKTKKKKSPDYQQPKKKETPKYYEHGDKKKKDSYRGHNENHGMSPSQNSVENAMKEK